MRCSARGSHWRLRRGSQRLHGRVERWREFGRVPERAYALLGLGRCLLRLGGAEADVPLREAQKLFSSLGYNTGLAKVASLVGSPSPTS